MLTRYCSRRARLPSLKDVEEHPEDHVFRPFAEIQPPTGGARGPLASPTPSSVNVEARSASIGSPRSSTTTGYARSVATSAAFGDRARSEHNGRVSPPFFRVLDEPSLVPTTVLRGEGEVETQGAHVELEVRPSEHDVDVVITESDL